MSTAAPTSILDQLLQPIADCFTPEVARELLNYRVSSDTQARIDELADKCTEGELSPPQQAEYESYVQAIEMISLLQAKARQSLQQCDAS